MVHDTIKELRLNNNMSQTEFARALNVSQPMISAIESGLKPVPPDILSSIPIVLDDARSKAMLAYETGGEFFKVPLLRNVDDNPKNVLEVLIEEMSEAITSIQDLKKLIKNVRPGMELEDDLKEEVYQCEEQIADLYAALKMHFVSMESYGIELKIIERSINQKLIRKEYV